MTTQQSMAPETTRPAMIIDSHMHLDNVIRHHPDRIRWMAERRIVPVSWAFAEGITDVRALERYLAAQADAVGRLHREGFQCYFLTGVHPRSIPPDLEAGEIGDLVAPHLANPLCLGIGEIGLETGSRREVDIFEAHLALGKRIAAAGGKIGIHTPRQDKPRMTDRIIEVLSGFPSLAEQVVVDHCTEETVARVLSKGYRAGITLSPVKTSPESIGEIARRYADQAERIMCNTDSGTEFYEDLYRAATSPDIEASIRALLTQRTAALFWGIPAGASGRLG